LAGTVVYSTQHQLEPAHVVRPGETLETIARQYNVPWQLLAKINGIAAVDQVQPGQQIKVVPGPFAAIVDLRRSQLTLMVDGRYAGKFPVKIADATALKEGEWVVKGKPTTTPSQPAPTAGARQLVLTEADAATQGSASPLVIGSQPSSQPTRERIGADGQITSNAIPYVAVSPADAEELADILSVGSRVTIRR
jgi:LysM repeat protein